MLHLPGLGWGSQAAEGVAYNPGLELSRGHQGMGETASVAVIVDPGSVTDEQADPLQKNLSEPQFCHLQNGEEPYLPLRRTLKKIPSPLLYQ